MEILVQEIQELLSSDQPCEMTYRKTVEAFQKYLFISNTEFFTLKREDFDSFGNLIIAILNKFYGSKEGLKTGNRLILKQLADLILKIDLNCGDENFCAKMIESIQQNLLTGMGHQSVDALVKAEGEVSANTKLQKSTSNPTQKQFGMHLIRFRFLMLKYLS